jgi:hypothetical protein
MDDFFDEIDKVIGRKPKDEPKCGMDKLVEKMADEEAEYWEMKAEVHFGI